MSCSSCSAANITPRRRKHPFDFLREAGFENLNIDLMFGLPGQTLAQWEATLRAHDRARTGSYLDLLPDLRGRHGIFSAPRARRIPDDPEADADFFTLAGELLGRAGFDHYEISNYARPGFESVHNRAYWAGEDYLGIGPSAVSTVGLAALAERFGLPRLCRSASPRGIARRPATKFSPRR